MTTAVKPRGKSQRSLVSCCEKSPKATNYDENGMYILGSKQGNVHSQSEKLHATIRKLLSDPTAHSSAPLRAGIPQRVAVYLPERWCLRLFTTATHSVADTTDGLSGHFRVEIQSSSTRSPTLSSSGHPELTIAPDRTASKP